MNSPYKNAFFLKSITSIRQAPFSSGEVAFVGRSNCGKSSLINVVTEQNKIAKVSKSPGRTRQINFFALGKYGEDKFLVDLPGYGYAKVSEKMQKSWQGLIESYLSQRSELGMVFILMDARHILSKLDQVMIDFCFKQGIDFGLVSTKADKLKQAEKHQIKPTIQSYLKQNYRLDFDKIYLTSSFKKTGFEPLIEQLDMFFTHLSNKK